MTSYILGPEALQDLHDLWDYIAGENLDAADRQGEDNVNKSQEFQQIWVIGKHTWSALTRSGWTSKSSRVGMPAGCP
jgi:plasmid stabilization system protein ParE